MRVTPLILALLVASNAAFAQHSHTGAAAGEVPARLIENLGGFRFPVSTASAEAQKFFDQGAILLYGFNHDEAARSFRRAAELDPSLAMAHWGVAMSVGPNYNQTQISPERMKAA